MGITYCELILGEKTDSLLRRLAINLAILGFLLHLLICLLYRFQYLDLSETNDFFDSYLDSLYTPFSIILSYDGSTDGFKWLFPGILILSFSGIILAVKKWGMKIFIIIFIPGMVIFFVLDYIISGQPFF